MTPEQAYDEVCRLAREHALIHGGYGGVVVIIHPDTQRELGTYEHIQWVHGLGPHPSEKVRRCRVCGCTDDDCSGCIERTGVPCHWVKEDLCSACANLGDEEANREEKL
jgi:hypothetical protein